MQRSRTAGAVASGNPAGVSLSDSLSGVPGHCVSLLDGLSQGAESGWVPQVVLGRRTLLRGCGVLGLS